MPILVAQTDEWVKAFDTLDCDTTPAIVRAMKIYRAEVRVSNMRTIKRQVDFIDLATEEGCIARNESDKADGQSLVTDHLSVAWISECFLSVSVVLTLTILYL